MANLVDGEWTVIGSGLIKSAMYDRVRGTLTLYLKTGHIYDYLMIPEAIASGLASAEDPEEYFQKSIANHFDYRIMSQTHRW